MILHTSLVLYGLENKGKGRVFVVNCQPTDDRWIFFGIFIFGNFCTYVLKGNIKFEKIIEFKETDLKESKKQILGDKAFLIYNCNSWIEGASKHPVIGEI